MSPSVKILTIISGLLINLSVLLPISGQVVPYAYAYDTHMTLHNLMNQFGDEGPAELSILDGSNCTAQADSNCEAGADYVWYTVSICVPSCENDGIWQTTMHGVYGSCDVYVTVINGTVPPKFQASHHCSAAEKAGLKPPLENVSNSTSGNEPSCGIQCNARKANP